MVLFTCSGIAVKHKRNITRFVTSASLVKALFKERKYHDNLKVGAGNHPLLILFFYIR